MFVMMAFCGVGSAYAIVQGKRDHANHVSVAQQNRDRHAKASSK